MSELPLYLTGLLGNDSLLSDGMLNSLAGCLRCRLVRLRLEGKSACRASVVMAAGAFCLSRFLALTGDGDLSSAPLGGGLLLSGNAMIGSVVSGLEVALLATGDGGSGSSVSGSGGASAGLLCTSTSA